MENQDADPRIVDLVNTAAAVRWISAEPLLGPVDVEPYLTRRVVSPAEELTERMVFDGWSHPGGIGDHPGLDWIVVGGESGPGARPMHPQWARDIRDQCVAAGVPFHFKQWGEHVFEHFGPDGLRSRFVRVGKKRAGRMLDGRTWDELPA